MKQNARHLNQKIKDLEEVKQYLFYKKTIQEDASLQKILQEMKETQLQMKDAIKNKKWNDYENLKKKMASYRLIFEQQPVFQNYLHYREDVRQILEEIMQILKWD